MAFDLFSPPDVPHLGSDFQLAQRALENSYGDGFGQSAPDGLNSLFWAGTLVWNAISATSYDYVRGFWLAKGVVTPFRWQKPGEAEPRQWKFTGVLPERQVAKRASGDRIYATSVTIKESFEVG